MPKIVKERRFCVNCLKLEDYEVASGFDVGKYPDLDSRPTGGERLAHKYSVQLCPYCGYANFRIDKDIDGIDSKLITKSSEYTSLFKSQLDFNAKKFLLSAFLYETAEDIPTAAYLYMSAAWMLDDNDDSTNAVALRKRALSNLAKLPQTIEIICVEVDLMRRCAAYKDAIRLARHTIWHTKPPKDIKKQLKLEISLCHKKCHTLYNSSVLFKR